MRAILILVVLAILGFFGYQYAVEGRSPGDAVGVLTGGAATPEAADEQAPADDAAAEEAVEDAVDDTATAIEDATEDAATAVDEATDDAAAAVEEATDDAAAAVDEAAETLDGAADAAAETADAAADTGNDLMAAASELLTVEGFDADRVIELVEGADIPDLQKTTLTTAINSARDNPELLQPVLDRVKQVMGLE